MSSLPKGKRKRKRNEKAFWYGTLNNVGMDKYIHMVLYWKRKVTR